MLLTLFLVTEVCSFHKKHACRIVIFQARLTCEFVLITEQQQLASWHTGLKRKETKLS